MSYFSFDNKAISFAVRIVIGCLFVWWSLDYIHDAKKIWALISVIVVSDPNFSTVRDNAISRLVNTLMGCIMGLIFVYLFGTALWSMMIAVAVSVVLSTSFKNYPSSWKLAPITVIILMMPYSTETETWKDAMNIALTRTGEVLYGSLVAFLLGLLYLKLEERLDRKRGLAKKEESKVEGSKDVHE